MYPPRQGWRGGEFFSPSSHGGGSRAIGGEGDGVHPTVAGWMMPVADPQAIRIELQQQRLAKFQTAEEAAPWALDVSLAGSSGLDTKRWAPEKVSGRGKGKRKAVQALTVDDNDGPGGEATDMSTAISWNPQSTLIPEVPTILGDTAGGGIMTMRLVAVKGRRIEVCQGDTITLVASGTGPMSGETVSLEVEDIIYGAMAYVNLLVEGGTTASGGGRSRSRSDAYVRVVQN